MSDEFAGEGAGILLSEGFAQYAARQIRSGAWTDHTQKYTHEPSITLFRELVGDAMPARTGSPPADPIIGIELASLTPSLVSTFLDEFWSFPARQGKRSTATNARELLLQGGEPQSRANVFKRLGHIKQFIAFCVESQWVDPQVLTRIERVIRSDSIRNRQRTTLERAALDGIVDDGYVSFTKEEVDKLFGPLFIPHVGARAARYWIPLIGYCTGMRLNEICQLQPSHFIEIDGVPCIAVKPNTSKARKVGSGYEYDAPPARVKNLASIRNVPIHPWLVSLGLLDYAKSRSDGGARLMWDDLRYFPRAGFGKYPGRDFTELAIKTKVHVPKRKVFHSFRSTITQMLGAEEIDSELTDRFLGHEVQTTKQRNYGRTDNGRAFPIKRMHEILSKVRLELDVPPWAAVSSNVGLSNVHRAVGSRSVEGGQRRIGEVRTSQHLDIRETAMNGPSSAGRVTA